MLHIEKIIGDKRQWLVIALSPIPTVKLSIDTDKPNISNPVLLTDIVSSSLKLEIIKSIPIYISIIEAMICRLMKLILSINIPKVSPINGITKWYIPTRIAKKTFFLSDIPTIPYTSANEKASILRLIPIKRIVKKEAIISPN